MPHSMLAMVAVYSGLMGAELCYYAYRHGINQFYPLLVVAQRSPSICFFASVLAVVLGYVAFGGLIRLLFGSLSNSEREYLEQVRWSVFSEFATTYVLFQPMLTFSSWAHIAFMYCLVLITLLLERRIEEVCSDDREDQDLANPQAANRPWAHQRIALIITLLYLANWLAIRHQSQYLRYASGRWSLITSVTVHRYVTSSAMLAKCIIGYLLNLVEARHHPPPDEWEAKPVLESVCAVVTTGLVAASNAALVTLIWYHHVRAISLFRLAIRNGKRFISAARSLVAALGATRRLANFPEPTTEELARDNTCAICLEMFTRQTENRKVPGCGHIFHYRCLKRWARTTQSCPSCRAPL